MATTLVLFLWGQEQMVGGFDKAPESSKAVFAYLFLFCLICGIWFDIKLLIIF